MPRGTDQCCPDRELYLPQEWAGDPARRAEAGVPADARCLPKPTLGTHLLERASAAGGQAAWVTADSIYGGAYKLRHYLEEREQPFVLAVQSTQRVGLWAKAEQVVASWPVEAWQRLWAGEGREAKGRDGTTGGGCPCPGVMPLPVWPIGSWRGAA
jgi:SRSO17 transposase